MNNIINNWGTEISLAIAIGSSLFLLSVISPIRHQHVGAWRLAQATVGLASTALALYVALTLGGATL
jgi:hypothetical protein